MNMNAIFEDLKITIKCIKFTKFCLHLQIKNSERINEMHQKIKLAMATKVNEQL
jgi:hypothetical protein